MSAARQTGKPIPTFLGEQAGAGGPFALLGVEPGIADPAHIIAAVERQLRRVDEHPQASTPAGDEVRLALHAAAAQLMDPGVRRQMEFRFGRRTAQAGGQSGGVVPVGAPVATESAGLQSAASVALIDTAVSDESNIVAVSPPPARFVESAVEGSGAIEAVSNTAHPAAVPPTSAMASPARSPQSSLLLPAFEHEARRALAMAGGPNSDGLRRIAILAAARGMSPADVPAIVRELARSRGDEASAPAGRAPALFGQAAFGPALAPPVGAARGRTTATRVIQMTPESFVSTSATGGPSTLSWSSSLPLVSPAAQQLEDDRATRAVKAVVLFALLGVLLMGGAFWTVLVLTTPTAPAPAAERDPESLIGHMPEPEMPDALFPRGTPPPQPQQATGQPPPVIDAIALSEELRAAIGALSVDPEAVGASFRSLAARAGASWDQTPLDRRRAIVDLVVEYVYRAAGTPAGPVAAIEDAGAAAALLTGGGELTAEQVSQAAWSVGVLVRLQRERDISARAGSLIESKLGAALQGARPIGASAFDAGAAAALGVMPSRLVPSSDDSIRTRPMVDRGVEAWKRWLSCVAVVTGSDTAARTGLILSGLNVLIHDAPQPTDDRLVFEAMSLLIEGMDWSEAGAARQWLVRIIDAPGVSTADAHTLANAVATRAPAAGLDVSLVPAPRATDLERREMRDRLAILWNLTDQSDHDEIASAWREGRADALARRDSDLTPFEHLATAVVLSRISEAAMLRWRGMTEEADMLLLALADDVDATLTAAASTGSTVYVQDAGDGQWAEQYLLANRSIPIRLDLLRQASTSFTTSIGPVDAEVLMREAVRGSPAPVATAAYDIVMRLVGSPSMVNALLEELPQIPKTRRNAQMVAALTGSRLPLMQDARWEIEARRATVARLLELLAASGDLRTFDELSLLLAQSYEARAESNPGRARASDPPELTAAVLRSGWRRQAEPLLPPPGLGLTLDEVERRRASRMELAEGPVQTFAAEQLAGVELMALVVAGEQPEQTEAVRVVLDDLARARQRARHIAEQIVAGEAASTALWGIRLKEGATP